MAATPAPQDWSNLDPTDLGSPALYINRELSWLAFNERVLAQAQDASHPLLERIKFLAIDGDGATLSKSDVHIFGCDLH